MYPIEGEIADRVRATYVARNATRETSKSIIQEIAAEEDITEAKVRHMLSYGGPGYVRWTKEERVWSDHDGKLRTAFVTLEARPADADFIKRRRHLLATLSDELLYTQKAITDFAKSEGFWLWTGDEKSRYDAETKAAREKEEAREKANRAAKERSKPQPSKLGEMRASLKGSQQIPILSFEDRLNGHAGWFGNPLWVLNTIVMIFLVALVCVGVASIFK